MLFGILLWVYLWWAWNHTEEFIYFNEHPEIGKKMIFIEKMIKIKNLRGWSNIEFKIKYKNYILDVKKMNLVEGSATEIEYVKKNEPFLIKKFFKYHRNGIMTSNTDSAYYILEDSNKYIYVLPHYTDLDSKNKPIYKKYNYIIRK
jgi:hypothetical protein